MLDVQPRRAATTTPSIPSSQWRQVLRELVLVAFLFGAYKIGRLAAAGSHREAFHHAQQVWGLERWLQLPSEAGIQRWLVDVPALPHLATMYYAWVHFPATVALLVWLYLRDRQLYRRTRTTLALLTGAALVVHLLYPLAPPRMMTSTGMHDLSAQYGPHIYGDPATDTFANQYAAMPSLHVGWALLVAGALIAAGRTRTRLLWLLHPAATLVVVIATGHHFWLDAIVVSVLLLTIHLLLPPARPGGPATVPPASGRDINGVPRQRDGYAADLLRP
ncbi:phosphatase PAP2 family protein [Actinoplanes sp. NPDC026623]|uniref:phosphatase PAP2 family protein n=1 Tax=Actinoplanes sp. NPDC026623 TaxID=3155610 RepID=UPI0033EF0CA6